MRTKVTTAANSIVAFSCTIPGNPGDAAVNGWKEPTVRRKGSKFVAGSRKSDKYRAWQTRAALAFRAAARGRRFEAGPLAAKVTAYWPRMARTGAAKGLAFGDVDAIAKATLDALEAAGVLGSDGQIVELQLAKAYSAASPRIEVEVRRA